MPRPAKTMTLEDKINALVCTLDAQSEALVKIQQALCLFADAFFMEHNFQLADSKTTAIIALKALRNDLKDDVKLEQIYQNMRKNMDESFDSLQELLDNVRKLLIGDSENEQQ